MTAPCKGCPDRKLHCHSVCEKYKKFQEETERIRKIRGWAREHNEYMGSLTLNKYKRVRKLRGQK